MLVLWGARGGDVQAGSSVDRALAAAMASHAEIDAGLVLHERQEELLSRFFDLDGTAPGKFVTFKPVKVGER